MPPAAVASDRKVRLRCKLMLMLLQRANLLGLSFDRQLLLLHFVQE